MGGNLMNHKERIINLVKQNVISIEEALNLLEAVKIDSQSQETNGDSQLKTSHSLYKNASDKGRDFAKEINEYFNNESVSEDSGDQENSQEKAERIEEIEKLNLEIRDLEKQESKLEEEILISQQRLKEFDILSELENQELSPELQEQAKEHEEKLIQLKSELSDLQKKLADLRNSQDRFKEDRIGNYKQDFREFINESTEKITSTANKFGEEAVRESKKFGKIIGEKSKDFFDNFNFKDIQLKFSFPWIKSSQDTYQKEFCIDNFEEIDLALLNGSVNIQSHDSSQISMEAQVKYFGNNEEVSYDLFESLSLVEADQGKFICHVKSPKLAVDLNLKVPRNDYQKLRVDLTNGKLDISSLSIQELQLNNKNGDLLLENIGAESAEIEVLNGQSHLKNNDIETIIYKIFNGDLRIEGTIKNLSTDTVNTNYYLTKTDSNPSNIKISTLKGLIKLSLPAQTNLDIKAKANKDKILSRLSQIQENSYQDSEEKSYFQRYINSESPDIRADLETKTDSIYLKDN